MKVAVWTWKTSVDWITSPASCRHPGERLLTLESRSPGSHPWTLLRFHPLREETLPHVSRLQHFAIAALSEETISGRVPVGAATPYQFTTSYPGTPDSAIV